MRIRREVSYPWRLREVMATRGLFATTELVPLLAERSIGLSASQVHRLVTGIPSGCRCRCWRRGATSWSAPRPS